MIGLGGWDEERGPQEREPGRVRCKEGEREGCVAGGAGMGVHLQVRL